MWTVDSVDVSADSRRFATGTTEGASIWSVSTGRRVVGPPSHKSLVTIKADLSKWGASTPLAWSSDGQQIFAASHNNRVTVFDASTGTQLVRSQILDGGNDNVASITLATNGKFIATYVDHSVLFLDTSTLARIGPVIESGERLWSVAIHDLGKTPSDWYTGPFNVNIVALACFISRIDKICGIYSQTGSTRRGAFDIR